MATTHMQEIDILRDPQALLARLEAGDVVMIERGEAAIAFAQPSAAAGRTLSQAIAIGDYVAATRGYDAAMDDDFADDMIEILRRRDEARSPSAWD